MPLPQFLVSKASVASSSFDAIPVIDFSNLYSTDSAERRALADKILDACVNVGFFYLKDPPGLPASLPYDIIEKHAKRFFALPQAEKDAIDIHKSWEDGKYESDAGEMAGTNVWPNENMVPGFREGILEYYHAVVQLGLALFPLFALALDLPENFFDDKTTRPAAIMRILHYPPQPEPVDGILGIGRHTDYECFTLLYQHPPVRALQVQNTDGVWIDADPMDGAFVVNIGDQLARWTNDVFKSTPHRARNLSGQERYSMPLFFGTDYDVLLETIPTCLAPGEKPKYPIVTAGEYVKSRLAETYQHSRTDS
ncbi:Clavaminate synthase-like protein [Fistulina hepatica ATCC 64428]|uniref:Clavaminate synthase-like protein n=1 Tax=Fistulina hepatica ATCC 64428 TaxID=1128425 RepID=A0A0D7ACS3_9AGAR|nr:Clavaminate synthase-like protein [Fistulina hepatica ATCC 64428]